MICFFQSTMWLASWHLHNSIRLIWCATNANITWNFVLNWSLGNVTFWQRNTGSRIWWYITDNLMAINCKFSLFQYHIAQEQKTVEDCHAVMYASIEAEFWIFWLDSKSSWDFLSHLIFYFYEIWCKFQTYAPFIFVEIIVFTLK